MALHSTCDAPIEVPAPMPREARAAETGVDAHARTDAEPRATSGTGTDAAEGWDALALAELGRPLTPAEHALTRSLPVEEALDRLFPALSDAARHEALWALG